MPLKLKSSTKFVGVGSQLWRRMMGKRALSVEMRRERLWWRLHRKKPEPMHDVISEPDEYWRGIAEAMRNWKQSPEDKYPDPPYPF